MKFSLVVLSIFASVASGAYLRKSAVAVSNNAVGEESFGSRIQISGLPHIPTNAELAILDRVLIDAYNSAHKNLDKEMVSSNSHIAIGLNNTTVIISEFVAQSDSSYCSLCDDGHDDIACFIDPHCRLSASEVDFMFATSANIHRGFEKRMCKKLRASGVENFSRSRHCSFNILENPGSFSGRLSEKVVYEALDGRATGVEVSVLGLKNEPSEDEVKYMESAVYEAHNDAFLNIGYALTDFDAVSLLPYDTMDGAYLIFGTATPVLKGENSPDPTVAVNIHQAFETNVCKKFKSSGIDVFARVHDCSFNFVYNPVKEATITKEGGESAKTSGVVVSAIASTMV